MLRAVRYARHSTDRQADGRATRSLPAIIQNEKEAPDVRWAAAEALGEIGDARAFEPLFWALTSDTLGRAAKDALIRVISAESIPALVDALHDKQPEVRL